MFPFLIYHHLRVYAKFAGKTFCIYLSEASQLLRETVTITIAVNYEEVLWCNTLLLECSSRNQFVNYFLKTTFENLKKEGKKILGILITT